MPVRAGAGSRARRAGPRLRHPAEPEPGDGRRLSWRCRRCTRLEERRAPVDIFFRTLAETHGRRAVSVVLSGTGADGSMGMKRVKECGGVCFVQDPDEAEHGDMPRACDRHGAGRSGAAGRAIPARIVAYQQSLRRDPRCPTRPDEPIESDDEGAARDLQPAAPAHRPRLQQLQAFDGAPPDRAAARRAQHPRHPQLRPVPARSPGRSRRRCSRIS